MKVPVVFLSFVLTLYGCGGGGGGGATFPGLPALMPAQSRNAPVVFLRDGVQVGADVRPARNALSPAGTHDGAAVSSGRVRDGKSADQVIKYLDGHKFTITGYDGYTEPTKTINLSTFIFKPAIKIRETTPQRYINDIVRAVQSINIALPYDWRITISPERAPHLIYEDIEDIPDGYIYLGIAPQDEWPMVERVEFRVGGAQSGTSSSSYIWVNPVVANTTSRLRKVIAHEMFHALGMRGHFYESEFPTSVMSDNPHFWNIFLPYVISDDDIDALYVLYSRFYDESGYEEYDPSKLGLWTDTSFHLRGDLDDVSFGVSSRNGLLQPWAFGPSPAMNLSDNQALSGSASWSGRLLGFTSDSQSLAGAADLTINLGTLTGRIDFTGLEHWGVNAAPGAIGSGTRWNDGDLRYSVIVRGNTFYQTGGDAGEVTGMFYGAEHQAMGGVLERSDLSAAFAGKR